jgi:dienelactone hydrolase
MYRIWMRLFDFRGLTTRASFGAIIVLGLGLWLSQSARAEPADAVAAPTALSEADAKNGRDQVLAVPVTDASGQITQIQTRVCRPTTDAPARLVVINHGSPPNSDDRPRMEPGRCDQEAARWFLSRGYVVAFPLRRGYGVAGGQWAESYGGCDHADYAHAGIETARDIDAAVVALTTLPYVRPDGVVVVGQSAGGWGTIAYDSLPHPKVAAFVVMAGGRGGHQDNIPNKNCHPERLAEAAGSYGATASTPMLWIYAANDSFFAPPIARALYQSFTAAGGRVEFEQPGPYGEDGHRLFFGRGGSTIWGPLVERYLSQQLAANG